MTTLVTQPDPTVFADLLRGAVYLHLGALNRIETIQPSEEGSYEYGVTEGYRDALNDVLQITDSLINDVDFRTKMAAAIAGLDLAIVDKLSALQEAKER